MSERIGKLRLITQSMIEIQPSFMQVSLQYRDRILRDALNLTNFKPFVDLVAYHQSNFHCVLPSQMSSFLSEMDTRISMIVMYNPQSGQKEPLGDFYPNAAIAVAKDAVWSLLITPDA